MAENGGRAGKSSGSGTGKGAVSAEQVRTRERAVGQAGWVQSRRERRGGSLWLCRPLLQSRICVAIQREEGPSRS